MTSLARILPLVLIVGCSSPEAAPEVPESSTPEPAAESTAADQPEESSPATDEAPTAAELVTDAPAAPAAAVPNLSLKVSYETGEVSKDSSSEDVRVEIDGSALTYRSTTTGRRRGSTSRVATLSDEDLLRLAELLNAAALKDAESSRDDTRPNPGHYMEFRISGSVDGRAVDLELVGPVGVGFGPSGATDFRKSAPVEAARALMAALSSMSTP